MTVRFLEMPCFSCAPQTLLLGLIHLELPSQQPLSLLQEVAPSPSPAWSLPHLPRGHSGTPDSTFQLNLQKYLPGWLCYSATGEKKPSRHEQILDRSNSNLKKIEIWVVAYMKMWDVLSSVQSNILKLGEQTFNLLIASWYLAHISFNTVR